MLHRHGSAFLLALLLAAGCGDDGGGVVADASSPDASSPGVDAAPADAEVPDAFDVCPGTQLFTGEYIDWDSSVAMFRGVPDATVAEAGNGANSDATSPNGRWELCIARDTDGEFAFTHADYLPIVFSMSAEANVLGPATVRGLKPAKADELFASPIGETRDLAAAQLLVDVRKWPGGDPVVGAQVSIGDATAASFTWNASRTLQSGSTITSGDFVFFANVAVGGGTTTVMVTPPSGTTCVGRASVVLEAGKIASTAFACQ